MRKYKKNTRLEVHWHDIVEDSAWVMEPEMYKEPDCLALNLGYYHHADDNFLYLSHSIMSDRRSKTTIPLGCIRKVVVLKPS